MIERNITPLILSALSDTPVALLVGARQTGKSTLVKWIVEQKSRMDYVTLDDATVLSAAKYSPQDFINELRIPTAIDEVQRAPELLLPIKATVDKKRKPGQFLLTGSADVLVLPRVSERLAGRMEILTLWPFSQGEIEGKVEKFVEMVFGDNLQENSLGSEGKKSLIRKIITGGFPEIQQRSDQARREAWFRSYITTILQREVRDISNVEGLAAMPRLLSLLASRTGSLLNFAEISNSSRIPQTTLKRYLALLEATYLVRLLPAWSGNLSQRLVKAPKVVFTDTGLMASLLGADEHRFEEDGSLFGRVLENFVVMELVKQTGWIHPRPSLFHFRTYRGEEVDIILERPDGKVVAVEVKASSTVTSADFKGLKSFSEIAKRRFHRGIILYQGSNQVAFGKNLIALPLNTLWAIGQ